MGKQTFIGMIIAVVFFITVVTPAAGAQSYTADQATDIQYSPAIITDDMPCTASIAVSTNSTMTRAEVLQERGVPGEGIDNARGLQKFFNNFSKMMERIRNRFHVREHEFSGGGISDNITATDNTTMTKSMVLKNKGVPGKGIDQAPGLQKPFNPNSNAANGVVDGNHFGVSDNETMNQSGIFNENEIPGTGNGKKPGPKKPHGNGQNTSD